MSFQIRPVMKSDHAAWDTLYQGYAEFYQVTQTKEMRDRVWAWLNDPAHEVNGLVAVGEHGPVGFAHFRAFARPLAAATGGYLDDLYIDPASRGMNVSEQLIDAIKTEGKQRGWSVIRWITAEDNDRARKVYDRVGSQTAWVTYDITI